MKNKMVLFYVPFPSEKSASKILTQLLENKIAVCIQIQAVASKYLWNNKISKAKEWVSIIKSNKQNRKQVIQFIKEHHPYEIPCIIELDACVNKKYASWMNSMLN